MATPESQRPAEARRKAKVYLAAPLFTQAERQWNRRLAAALGRLLPAAELVLPQDFRVEDRYNDRRNFDMIFRKCAEAIASADLVVALLDGADADSGTAFEVGYAAALGVPVIGVRTDYRAGQDRGANLMCARACRRFVFDMSFREDLDALAADVARKVAAELAGRRPQGARKPPGQ